MKPHVDPPVHAAWEITRRCNAQCLHCSSMSGSDAGGAEPDTTQARHIIDQLAGAGVRVLGFSGGEPLLREDLPNLIEHAVARGLTTHVCTNGSLITANIAARLRETGLHSITVSLDGACADTHEGVRRCPGLFDRALSAIPTLVQYGHRVSLSFTPTMLNWREAAAVVHLAYTSGADSVCISQYIPTGRGSRELMLSLALSGELARAIADLKSQYTRRLRIHCHDCHVAFVLPPKARQEYRGCGAATATVGIRADGAITPCVFMPLEAGNLNKSSFTEIWNSSPSLKSMRNRELLKEGNCGTCAFKLVCGGCRAAAMAIHGNPLAGDPSCWLFPDTTLMESELTTC